MPWSSASRSPAARAGDHELVGDGEPLLGVRRGSRARRAGRPAPRAARARRCAARPRAPRRSAARAASAAARSRPRSPAARAGAAAAAELRSTAASASSSSARTSSADRPDAHGQPGRSERRAGQQLAVAESARHRARPRRSGGRPRARRPARWRTSAEAEQQLHAQRVAPLELARGGPLEQRAGVLVGERTRRLLRRAQRALAAAAASTSGRASSRCRASSGRRRWSWQRVEHLGHRAGAAARGACRSDPPARASRTSAWAKR